VPEVISAYQTCVAETMHRFDGFVAKYMGDGVLVYFGYPQAHEDVDLRPPDRHPDAAITSLIPPLSCRSCRPHAPFAELVRLSRLSVIDECSVERGRAVLGE
jgi:class 3 adenylate cyclase